MGVKSIAAALLVVSAAAIAVSVFAIKSCWDQIWVTPEIDDVNKAEEK